MIKQLINVKNEMIVYTLDHRTDERAIDSDRQ